jgi:choline dehydrogenase
MMTGAEEPQSKVFDLPRGKTLGGTHSINAAAYVQANADDFNDIARELGDSTWEWTATASLRSKLENELGIVKLAEEQLGATEFIRTAMSVLGFPFNREPTNGQQFGISPSFWTARQTEDGGKRRSSFDAFVLPFMDEASSGDHGSVDVVTYHHVEHLIFDPDDNSKVIGVSSVNTRANNIPTEFFASEEVIVAAGTYNSPQILLHSGLGPRSHLEDMHIETKHNLPGVGANLRDHYAVATYWNLVGLEPDTPFLFQSPILNMFGPEPTGLTKFQIELSGNYGSCVPLRQESHGTVRLQSNSPFALPLIDPNVLSTTNDIDQLVECLRDYLLPFFDGLIQQGLLSPGNLDPSATDEELRSFVIQNVASNHHPVGTCKVGPDGDHMAVLDKDFKVRGVSNLRVIDASVFPRIPSGNINAPVMTAAMIGAKKIIQDRSRRLLRGSA